MELNVSLGRHSQSMRFDSVQLPKPQLNPTKMVLSRHVGSSLISSLQRTKFPAVLQHEARVDTAH